MRIAHVTAALCFLIGVANSPLHASSKTTLTLERQSAVGVEQTTLQIDGSKLLYVANTNYWQEKDSPSYVLGVLATTTASPFAQQLSRLAKTAKPWKRASENFHQSPHATKVKINEELVPHGSALYTSAIKLIHEATESAPQWKSVDSVSVKRDAKTGALMVSNGEKLDCGRDPAQATSVCTIKGYGYVHR